jgi:prolyl oligopeptidase
VLDLDALNKAEGENWVWHGADCLRPDYSRCLIALSRGGADADVTREFDLANKTWIKDGFFRPESKGGLNWIDRDTVFVYTDFGGLDDHLRLPARGQAWKRGTPMASATVVYEGKPEDMYIAAMHDDTPGFERNLVSRTLAFYNNELYLRGDDGTLTKIDAPNSAEKGLHKQWLTWNCAIRGPWAARPTRPVRCWRRSSTTSWPASATSTCCSPDRDHLAGQRHLDQEPRGAERAG